VKHGASLQKAIKTCRVPPDLDSLDYNFLAMFGPSWTNDAHPGLAERIPETWS